MELPKDLKDEIWQYCMANDITDVNNLIINLVKSGFTIEKYGYDPSGSKSNAKVVEKEVIKEVIKEVPVVKEVIKEVIKEVPVEKIVKVSDDAETNKLLSEINELNNKQSVELSEHNETVGSLEGSIVEFEKKVIELEEKIVELEKNKSDVNKGDIYGERLKGRMGSNLLD